MRYRLLHYLRCPSCPDSRLTLTNVREEQDEDVVPGAFARSAHCACKASRFHTGSDCVCWTVNITAGELVCASCGATYAIRDSVPRMLHQHDSDGDAELRAIKEKTSKSFGFEWNHYNDLGWLEARQKSSTSSKSTKEIEKQSFLVKGLAVQQEFEGKLILDGGCGNGRYCYQARELGGEVIGVDLSAAVDAAARNLRRHPDVHIVQGDLFKLPLAVEIFDRIFSIGVLMHTGDARRAFASVVRHLKPDGIIAITVYRKGNAVYEYVDRVLRKRTVELEHQKLMRLSERLAGVARVAWNTRYLTFGKPAFYSLFNCFIRLESKTHNVFDWYSAPYASHHTYGEVHGWFRENNCEVMADRNRRKNVIVRLLASPAGGVTVKGRKRGTARQAIPEPLKQLA